MKSPIEKIAKFRLLTFWQEFRARCGFIAVIGLTNPVFITLYVMFVHESAGGIQFWLVGHLLTAVICGISSLFMAMVIYTERRRLRQELKRELMWHDAMPYDGKSAKAG